ncbi:MAG: AAA family ATPase, partial [Bdellovibrionaceae bacterium]|nr:AAA family ATPase [Pseudobdellovibrionaceae bacterium]
MLRELKVKNFAIIDEVHLEFKEGLNILSGETGAGKSVLLKSLALLMGAKASADTIRSGSEQATIEGVFDISARPDVKDRLTSMGIETEEDMLVVRRIVSAGDKSRIFLNGQASTLNSLRDIVSPLIEVTGHATPLIEMTGQHENRNLMHKAYHLDLLDKYAGTWEKRLLYEKDWSQLQQIESEIQNLRSSSKMNAQRLDFLIYQRDEIANLDLKPGEDVELEQNIRALKGSAKLAQFVDLAEAALYSDDDSALARIDGILKKSPEISSIDPGLVTKLEPLKNAKTLIEDTLFELRRHIANRDQDHSRLEELESRLSAIRKLQKKFGPTTDEILKSLLEIEIEIGQLQNQDSRIASLEAEAAALRLRMTKSAKDMHKKRAEQALRLIKDVNAELSDLNMKGVTFHVAVQELSELGPTGVSDIEFQTKTSPQDPPRPLAKVASGGELSRILLSLK